MLEDTITIVPNDSRYIPIVQQKWCCAAACISMIMLRHQIPLVPQEELGYYMGMVVPHKDMQLFWNSRTGAKPVGGFGTQIYLEEFNINTAFKRLSIPLKMELHSIDNFKSSRNLTKTMASIIENDSDAIVCFDWGKLYQRDYKGGHASVIDIMNVNKQEIRLIDPEYNDPKWRTVRIIDMYDAMRFHGSDKMAGIWEIKKI